MRNQYNYNDQPYLLENLDRQLMELSNKREELIASGTRTPMDPKDEQLVNLAYEAGEMTANFKSASRRAELAEKNLQDYISKDYYVQLIKMEKSRDDWRNMYNSRQDEVMKLKKRLATKRKK